MNVEPLLNAALAFGAVVANAWGAVRGDPNVRPLRVAVAALAALYACGYVVLAAGMDRLAWSLFFGRVAFVAWPVVWILPPVLAARAYRALEQSVREAFGGLNDET